jgi:hypothetical protein
MECGAWEPPHSKGSADLIYAHASFIRMLCAFA